MIESERRKTKGINHRTERLKQLNNMKSLTLLLQDVRTGPEALTGKVNKMEEEIQKVILETLDGSEDDDDYKGARDESKKTLNERIKIWGQKFWDFISL